MTNTDQTTKPTDNPFNCTRHHYACACREYDHTVAINLLGQALELLRSIAEEGNKEVDKFLWCMDTPINRPIIERAKETQR